MQEILVPGENHRVDPFLPRFIAKRRNDVIRLETRLLDMGDIHFIEDVFDDRNLCVEIIRRFVPIGLVGRKQCMNTMKQSLKERIELEQKLYRHTLDQEKMNRELERAHFLSLQSQINPHFLFNTLNTISHTALFEKADNTVSLINTLAGFLRYTLEFKDSVKLSTEFEFVHQYLDLQQARFKDRLGFSMERFDIFIAVLDGNAIAKPDAFRLMVFEPLCGLPIDEKPFVF